MKVLNLVENEDIVIKLGDLQMTISRAGQDRSTVGRKSKSTSAGPKSSSSLRAQGGAQTGGQSKGRSNQGAAFAQTIRYAANNIKRGVSAREIEDRILSAASGTNPETIESWNKELRNLASKFGMKRLSTLIR